MRSRTRGVAIVGSLALGLALAGCSGTGSNPSDSGEDSASAPAEVVVGMTPTPNAATVHLGIQEGFFEEEGLDVEAKTIQAAASAIPSLLADELQYALVSAVPSATAASKGLAIRIALGNDRYNDDSSAVDGAALIVDPESGITDVADLEGRTVAIVGLKSAPELAMRLTMRAGGADPDAVNFLEIPYPDMLSSVGSGQVDAALSVDPFLSESLSEGMEVISQPFIDGMGGMSGVAVVSSEAFLNENPEVAERFERAMENSVEFAVENPDAVREILGTYTSMSEEAIANSTLPIYDANITADDVGAIYEAMVDEGFVDDESWDPDELVWAQ